MCKNISPPFNDLPVKRRKSDFTFAFIDSREQVKKLSQKAQNPEMGHKIVKMRIAANSDPQKSPMAPESKAQNQTPGPYARRASLPMSHSTINTKFCKDVFPIPPKLIEVPKNSGPTTANTYSKSKFAPLPENSLPYYPNSPVEEVDEESSPGMSESPQKD